MPPLKPSLPLNTGKFTSSLEVNLAAGELLPEPASLLAYFSLLYLRLFRSLIYRYCAVLRNVIGLREWVWGAQQILIQTVC